MARIDRVTLLFSEFWLAWGSGRILARNLRSSASEQCIFVSKNSGFRALVLHSRTNVPILSPDRQLRNNGTMARHGPDWTISSVLILELWRHGWRSYIPPLEHHTTAQMALARLNHKCWSSQRQQKWGCGRARLNSKIQAYAALLQSLEPASRLSTESFGARQLNFHVSSIKHMSRLLNMLLILSLFILYAFILELLPQSQTGLRCRRLLPMETRQ